MEIRKLPGQESRVETGPVQFGDDWPGLFIRGDNALYYATQLRNLLDSAGVTSIQTEVLRGLVSDLESCLV